MLKRGTYKVAWVGANPNLLYSRMFPTVADARNFSSRLDDYMIMRLVYQDGAHKYAWKLLPYGSAPQYKSVIRAKRAVSSKYFIDTKEETITEYQKSQTVRLLDVFVIAPILLYVAINGKALTPMMRALLGTIGVLTLLYNGINYIRNRQLNQ